MKKVKIASFTRYAEAPDFRFRFDDCYFPHEVDTKAATFSPRWRVRNQGQTGTLVFAYHFRLPEEGTAWALWEGEVESGGEVRLVTEEPRSMEWFDIAGILEESNQQAVMVWLIGYLTEETEDTKYITVTDFWVSFTYILPWLNKYARQRITCDGSWIEFGAFWGRFLPEESHVPVPPETVKRDTPIDFDIQMYFGGVHDPFDFCGRHITVTANAMELRLYYNDKGPLTIYRWAEPINPPRPGAVHSWRLTKTVEELIGEEVKESGIVYLQFVLWFDICYTTNLGEVTHRYCELDFLGYSTPILVLVPMPCPTFVTELCHFCPAIVGRDDAIEPVFVLDNPGETGDFYIACLYAGMWREIFRGTIEAGERKWCTWEDITGSPTITMGDFMRDYFDHTITESESIDLTFYGGHFEPDKDPSETWDSRWSVRTWVEVGVPPPPPAEGLPWEVIALGVGAAATVGVVAYVATRRKR